MPIFSNKLHVRVASREPNTLNIPHLATSLCRKLKQTGDISGNYRCRFANL